MDGKTASKLVSDEYDESTEGAEIPDYISNIVTILPILFIPFPFIRLAEIMAPNIPQVNIAAESTYSIASLVSKSFLQWSIFFGFIFTNLDFSRRENPDKIFVDIFGPLIGDKNAYELYKRVDSSMN